MTPSDSDRAGTHFAMSSPALPSIQQDGGYCDPQYYRPYSRMEAAFSAVTYPQADGADYKTLGQ